MRRLLDWFFRDRRTGAIVVAQPPNVPLILFGVAALAAWALNAAAVPGPNWLPTGLDLVASAALAWWAVDEVARGVNPWRRCLGGGVLVLVLGRALFRLTAA